MLLGALDSLACVQDIVVGVDLFWGIVVHVAHVPLVVDRAQPNEKAVVQEPENGLPGARGNTPICRVEEPCESHVSMSGYAASRESVRPSYSCMVNWYSTLWPPNVSLNCSKVSQVPECTHGVVLYMHGLKLVYNWPA